MKARRKVRWFEGWRVGGLLLFLVQNAESQSFSEGKNLHQLRESLRGPIALSHLNAPMPPIGLTTQSRQTEAVSPVFLPRWSEEELPFFCRIEHDFAKKNALPVKFRLGSVEYVDWLEGKNSSFRY